MSRKRKEDTRSDFEKLHAEFVADTAARNAAPKGPAPEPLPEQRPAGLAADLEMRRARREAAEREGAPAQEPSS
ncbi:hypothetical protein BK022_07470 [Methylorubrum extorquens]|uniref:Uncharacterized protein n=1 Tax=Methylorubrum extorquens TaxID=408 RepID=A0A1S1P2D8_METEX|nr:hypothetical protein BK022_07470 [Methylorubrum extorquens]